MHRSKHPQNFSSLLECFFPVSIFSALLPIYSRSHFVHRSARLLFGKNILVLFRYSFLPLPRASFEIQIPSWPIKWCSQKPELKLFLFTSMGKVPTQQNSNCCCSILLFSWNILQIWFQNWVERHAKSIPKNYSRGRKPIGQWRLVCFEVLNV